MEIFKVIVFYYVLPCAAISAAVTLLGWLLFKALTRKRDWEGNELQNGILLLMSKPYSVKNKL